MAKKEKPKIRKRKLYFRILKNIMKMRYKRPAFVYLGEEIQSGGLILSNHEGTDAPMSLEIYSGKPLRMWGAHEMNSGLKAMYKYQTRVYYHEKKGWNLGLARMFCCLASPLTNLFYSGLDLISTYHDGRLMNTLKESVQAIKDGENIVVFPEDSTNGYLEQLEGFYGGYLSLCELCQRRGIDLSIFVAYYRKKDRVYIIDKPVKYSELSSSGATKEEISRRLCDRCNELGRMQFDQDYLKSLRKKQK